MTNKFWCIGMIAAIVVGCASPPPRLTLIEARDRAGYVKVADSQLDDWERDAPSKPPEDSRQMMALIRDARAEVRTLVAAPATDWEKYKSLVQSHFERIDDIDRKKVD